MYTWLTTRSGVSFILRTSTCSSCISTSSSFVMYAASVARPRGGKSEYLIGRKNGLVASVSAGRIILTLIAPFPEDEHRDLPLARAVQLDKKHALPAAKQQAA